MANGDSLKLGNSNIATSMTFLWKWPGGYNLGLQVVCDGSMGSGISGYGSSVGVEGRADLASGDGVFGVGHIGVRGIAQGAGSGVVGANTEAAGVKGSSTGPFGSGIGVLGQSKEFDGVVGSGGREWGSGVYGFGCYGVVGQSVTKAPHAFGVFAYGKLGATGAKYAAVPHADGRHRLLYSMESPESWFEDFGVSRLKGGVVRVRMPSDFAEVVRLREYHVFVTPHGECNGLCVVNRTSKAFEVRELGGGRSNVEFAFRIIARRKDIDAPRLPKVKLRKPVAGAIPMDPMKRVHPRPIPKAMLRSAKRSTSRAAQPPSRSST